MPTAQTGSVSSGDTIAVILSAKVPTLGTTNPTTGEYEYAGYVFTGWRTVQPQQDQTTGYQTCPNDVTLYQPGDNFGIDQTSENTQILYATWGAPARVTYNSNGLIYNNTPGDTINTVEYIPTYEGNKITGQRQNIVYTGTYNTPAYEETTPATNYIMKGWSEDQSATEATYKDEQEIIESLNLTADNNITLYAIWAYATVITFDGNGADSGVMDTITIEAGKTETLLQNTFTKTGYYFAGWNTEADESGDSYKNQSDYTATAGSNNVTLYAKWTDCAPNHICYKGNNADSTTNMDNVSQYTTGESIGKQVDLLASNFTKKGHGFAGWSEDKNAWEHLTDNNEANNPIIYGLNQMITVGDLSDSGMNLYAVWAPAETDNSGNPLSLQNWQGCSSLTATTYDNTTGTLSVGKNTVTALTDSRDSNIYTVARLADGNCWMTENLRIDNSATNESTTSEFTIANTNNPSLPFTNDYEQQVVSNRLSVSSSNWCVDIGVSCINQSNINTSNVTNPDASPTFNQDFTNRSHQAFNFAIKSYGAYYNWYSATTGRGKYETGGNEAVAGDICPAGWHLPYGGSGNNNKGKGNTSGGFYYLNQQMGGNTSAQDSNNWRSFPNNFVYSGNWNGSSAGSRGGTGLYWSSTAYRTTDFAYILYFYSGYLYPGTYDSRKNWGYPVRCVQNQ